MPRATDPFGAGKGDDRRPAFISRRESEARYALAFGKHPDTGEPLTDEQREELEASIAEAEESRPNRATYL